jgi:hypothetical protein
MSNISFEHTSKCPHISTIEQLYTYVHPLISVIGITSNLFGVLVLFQMIQQINLDGFMFKYLLIKSMNDCLKFIFHIFTPLYFCGHKCQLSYSMIIWYIGFYNYGEGIVELCGPLMEILASLDLYSIITSRMKIVNTKHFFYISVFVCYAYSVTFHFYFLFVYRIKEIRNMNQTVQFIIEESNFRYTQLGHILDMLYAIQLNLVIFIILLVLNTLLLIQLAKSYNRKKALLSSNRTSQVIANEKSLQNQKIVIFLINMNYFIGHFGHFIYYMYIGLFLSTSSAINQFWDCFYIFNLVFFNLSYACNIFILYLFNNHFKMFTHQNFAHLASSLIYLSNFFKR